MLANFPEAIEDHYFFRENSSLKFSYYDKYRKNEWYVKVLEFSDSAMQVEMRFENKIYVKNFIKTRSPKQIGKTSQLLVTKKCLQYLYYKWFAGTYKVNNNTNPLKYWTFKKDGKLVGNNQYSNYYFGIWKKYSKDILVLIGEKNTDSKFYVCTFKNSYCFLEEIGSTLEKGNRQLITMNKVALE